jgi:hypothetical protein
LFVFFAPFVILPARFRQERLVTGYALEDFTALTVIQTNAGPITLFLWLFVLTFPADWIKVQSLPFLLFVFFRRT